MKFVSVILLSFIVATTGCQTQATIPDSRVNVTQQPTDITLLIPSITSEQKIATKDITLRTTSTAPVSNIQKCNAKITELKRYDRKLHNTLRIRMERIATKQTFLNSSNDSGTAETVNYIKFQQGNSVNLICLEASQHLDRLMLKKSLSH